MKRIVALVLALVMVLSVMATASAVSYKKGSKGSGVLAVQKALNEDENGAYDVKEDGVYGTATVAAVKLFQKANGLTADGIAGPKTLAKLGITSNDNNPTPSTDDDGNDTSVMTVGSTGPKVKAVQQALKALNYPVGSADGKFGSKTRNAVKIFQSLNNLTVDGKVGETTYDLLMNGTPAAYNKSTNETSYTTLKLGSKDTTANKNAVTRLQKLLGITVTGYYNQATVNAVLEFQAANGLKEDGIAGPATWAALVAQNS